MVAPFGAPCHVAEYTQGCQRCARAGRYRLDGLVQRFGLSVSEACRGLRTEFRPFSRVLGLKSPASLSPQNSRSWTFRSRLAARPISRRKNCGEGNWRR